jgi:hypothetical protein
VDIVADEENILVNEVLALEWQKIDLGVNPL